VKEKNMRYADVKNYTRQLRREQTHSEQLLWSRLCDRQLEGYKFLRQHPILFDLNRNYVNFFIADFYCAKARLVIEIDGRIHEDKVEYDLWRQNIIEEMNLTVLRFKNDEVENLEATIATIREYLISITSNLP